MRILILPAVLVAIVAAIWLLIWAFRAPRSGAGPRWEATTELRDGVTHVFVRHLDGDRELGRQVVAEIPADAPDWDRRYHDAMAEARARAAALRSEG